MVDHRFGSLVIEESKAASSAQGTTVVFVHGLGGDSNSFQCQMSDLEAYHVLRPDLPGSGRSPYRPGGPSLRALAKQLRDALTALNIKEAHFVGHSMGTILCQYLAVDHPDLVKSLALFGPITEVPIAARQALSERAAKARREGMARIADQVSTGSVGAPARTKNPVTQAFVRESLMRQDPRGYASHCLALSTMKAAEFAKIMCPTLLIAGALDPVAPPAMTETLCEHISHSRKEVLTDVSHWMMIEDPVRVNELLKAHLNETV